MILAFDTYYCGNKAKTVCIAFANWTDKANYLIYSEVISEVEPYKSGEFYKRELPCITSLLKKIPFAGIEAIIVDGFAYLDDRMSPGLGGRLYEYLHGKVPVIGVAKSNFAMIHENKRLLYRGKSKTPLFINAAGMDAGKAAALIGRMAGKNRIPTLLKVLDGLTRLPPVIEKLI